MIRRNIDVIEEKLDLSGVRILDIGSGDGSLVRALTKRGAHVTGLECGAAQLEKARAAETVGDETYVEGFGQDLPFDDGAFDVSIFFNSLHHVPSDVMAAALSEAARVLKPGGTLYIAEPVAQGAKQDVWALIDDETEVRAEAYAALKASQSLALAEVEEISYNVVDRYDSAEAALDMMIRVDPSRAELVNKVRDDFVARFDAVVRPSAKGGFEMEQPMRVNIMVKQLG